MKLSERTQAILKALLVTFLWSTSWILIKFSIHEIPPLTFAGLRYSLAVLMLVPAARNNRGSLRDLKKRDWFQLVLLGLVFYALTQGAQFLTLKHLDATAFSLILNFTSIIVAILSTFIIKEKPSLRQWAGIAVFVVGAYVFFAHSLAMPRSPLGLILAGITVCANSAAALLSRVINRKKTIPPIIVSLVSMGTGAAILISTGLLLDGIPTLSLANLVVILWLAAVNTALAFTLWNQAQQILTAVEASIINSSMLIQIAVLSWIFLGESLGWTDIAGICIATAGLLLANLQNKQKNS